METHLNRTASDRPALTGLTRRLSPRLAGTGVSTPATASILAGLAAAQDATPAGTPTLTKVLGALGKGPGLIPHGTTNAECTVPVPVDWFCGGGRPCREQAI